MLIFSIPVILFLTILTKSFNKTVNRIISILLMLIITIYFGVQFVYVTLFSVPFSFSSIGMADQALDFVSIIGDTLLKYWYYILAILTPFIVFVILQKKIDYERYSKYSILSLVIMFGIGYTSSLISLYPMKNEQSSAYKLYYNIDDATAMIDKFGILTFVKIDVKRQLFGYESELVMGEYIPTLPGQENQTPEEIVYKDNVLNLDLDKKSSNKIINTLNNYIKQTQPTKQNEYTGMFEGKNLIFILAEGFNEIAVDEERTPTLYKMVNNGFVFNNFYSPVFLSTTGGEFQATTGLIPTQEILSLWKSNSPTMSYAIGHAFNNEGYRVQAYHNWTENYYKRRVTMKTLGYNYYKGCRQDGTGLEKDMNCGWLPYDSQMVEITTPEYLGKDGNFATYYITVSGHSPYNQYDNIGRHHYDTVKDLEYSSSVKYYLAAQVELDKMLEKLIADLTASGELDNTVIALVGDHYPYTLTTDEVNEVSDYKKDGVVEINRSNFILWNNAMEEPIVVDKVGSQIDVLPTLLNLFGLEYDSRLIVGKDILSDTPGIAIFSNRSWVSDYGTYFANSRKFVPKEGIELEDTNAYVNAMNQKVANAFSMSKMIMQTDYYDYILEESSD